ncbi:MAG: hypothetical protein Q7S36_03175, partial [Candidatus Liptonbacteria bacterium]|nr:hypothetical protein [Candidatus Liptonbacteria bacterium]
TTSTKQVVQKAASSKSIIVWTVFYPKTGTSKLFVFNKFSGKTEILDAPLPGETGELKFSNNEKLAVLQKNGDLYAYKRGTDVTLLTSGVNQFKFSPSGDALAILKNKTLEIYFENSEYLRLNLATFPEVSKLAWYADEKHLFLQFPEKLGLLDLDALDFENVQTIVDGNQNSYDIMTNRLYFIESDKLWKLDLPKK